MVYKAMQVTINAIKNTLFCGIFIAIHSIAANEASITEPVTISQKSIISLKGKSSSCFGIIIEPLSAYAHDLETLVVRAYRLDKETHSAKERGLASLKDLYDPLHKKVILCNFTDQENYYIKVQRVSFTPEGGTRYHNLDASQVVRIKKATPKQCRRGSYAPLYLKPQLMTRQEAALAVGALVLALIGAYYSYKYYKDSRSRASALIVHSEPYHSMSTSMSTPLPVTTTTSTSTSKSRQEPAAITPTKAMSSALEPQKGGTSDKAMIEKQVDSFIPVYEWGEKKEGRFKEFVMDKISEDHDFSLKKIDDLYFQKLAEDYNVDEIYEDWLAMKPR